LWQSPDFLFDFPRFFQALNYSRICRSKYGKAEKNRGENRMNTTMTVQVPTNTRTAGIAASQRTTQQRRPRVWLGFTGAKKVPLPAGDVAY